MSKLSEKEFEGGLYSLPVLLLGDVITIASDSSYDVLFKTSNTNETSLSNFVTDTIGELCTGSVQFRTVPDERRIFLAWFNANINNTEELYPYLKG